MVPAEPESSAVLDVRVPVTPVIEASQAGRRRLRLLPVAVAVVVVLAGSALFLSGYTMGRQAAAELRSTSSGRSTVFTPSSLEP